jgi:hypothetical protein
MMLVVTRTRTVITVFTLVSVLALGACSDDEPEPKFAPTPSTSAPTSPSTTAASGPTEPTMPAAAKGTNAASAEAFVTFYWEMVNYAQATGETSSLRKLGQKCLTCSRGIDSVEKVYEAGGEIRGGVGSLSAMTTHFLADPDHQRAVVEFTLTNTKQLVDYPGTARDKKYTPGSLAFQAMLERTASGWTVLLVGEQ